MKRYVLWLDESGDFLNEAKRKENNLNPSLVGGVLLTKEQQSRLSLDKLLVKKNNHTCELSQKNKVNYILPVLETVCRDYNAELVFFENTEYEDDISNRALYLRITAEGLLQTLLTLNAENESVELDVLIAHRVDITQQGRERGIALDEYRQELSKLIEKKKKEHKIILNEESSLSVSVAYANVDKRLMLADFACNTRLTRDSNIFKKTDENGVRYLDRLNALYNDRYNFYLKENSSENLIKRYLSLGWISDALIELYTTEEKFDREMILGLVIDKLRNTSYRIIRSELQHCSSEFVSAAVAEDDYEYSEQILLRIIGELIPALENAGIECTQLHTAVLMQLADMYIREGDICAARPVLEKCESVIAEFGYSLEEVFVFSRIQQKKAQLLISEFNYAEAEKLMTETSDALESILSHVRSTVGEKFGTIKSEYFADALSIKVSAMLYMLMKDSSYYQEICLYTDEASEHYLLSEAQLDSIRQYRSIAELLNGNPEEALRWLIRAETLEDYSGKDIDVNTVIMFLDKISSTENEADFRYYMMYLLIIMSSSCEKTAGTIMRAIVRQKNAGKLVMLFEESGSDENDIDISLIQDKGTGIEYHPLEIIWWKYASFHMKKGNYTTALSYYRNAVSLCFHKGKGDYTTMKIRGIAIGAERILCLLKFGKKSEAYKEFRNLKRNAEQILSSPLTEVTAEFVRTLTEKLNECEISDKKLSEENLLSVSEMILL